MKDRFITSVGDNELRCQAWLICAEVANTFEDIFSLIYFLQPDSEFEMLAV